jgi:hypothetical protein
MTKDGEAVCIADLVRRASVRQLRLHACGYMRLHTPAKLARKWTELLVVAERYADGEVGEEAFTLARQQSARGPPPRKWIGDIRWAFESDKDLQRTWSASLREGHTYQSTDPYYEIVLARHRLFEELIGPDPGPAFAPSWRTDTAVSLARQMYDAREFSAMPILADALQDAGCDNDEVLKHCRDPKQVHVRGCWVCDLVLEK